jgi:hypothetical protein
MQESSYFCRNKSKNEQRKHQGELERQSEAEETD